MSVLRSFRFRLLVGVFLGAAGVLAIAHVLSIVVMHHFPVRLRLGNGSVMVVVALAFIGVGVAQVRRGLSPFDRLRERLVGVRAGRSHRLDGVYPSEVQPLVTDLNALLDHRERLVSRALAKAGDLAHGLKTPLAVLAHEADCAEAAGQPDLATAIRLQVEKMRRQIDYHLAHARAAVSGAAGDARCSVAASVDGLSRTLLRLHPDRGLTIEADVPAQLAIRGQREDLDEMLGNLLDNACKWARSRVQVEASEEEGSIVILVDDDGPGLDPSMREAVLQRGVRADEAAPGSGLGLAIVSDLTEIYSGSISLGSSPMGGLRVRLRLPMG